MACRTIFRQRVDFCPCLHYHCFHFIQHVCEQRIAFCHNIQGLILFITALAYLTITPHAVLLSVTGNLFPSSFSDGLIPLLCFEVFILSLIYGIFGGTITSINGFWNCVTKESNSLLPVLFLYLLSIQLYHCFVFVFG